LEYLFRGGLGSIGCQGTDRGSRTAHVLASIKIWEVIIHLGIGTQLIARLLFCNMDKKPKTIQRIGDFGKNIQTG
jgi:hypothetical protein